MRVLVEWLPDNEGTTPDVTLMDVPVDIYEAGMTDWSDPVANWLSDKYGYLVLDWRLAAVDLPESDDEPTQCAGLSGECPNPPDANGWCWVHQSEGGV